MCQMSKPSDNKYNEEVIEDLEKQLSKVPFITAITQKVHRKNYTKKQLHMKLIRAWQLIWCVTGITTPSPHFPLPTLCRPIRIFILDSQLTRWELFSTSVSDKKQLPTAYMWVPITLHSVKKYLFTNTHRNETNRFSHFKAK